MTLRTARSPTGSGLSKTSDGCAEGLERESTLSVTPVHPLRHGCAVPLVSAAASVGASQPSAERCPLDTRAPEGEVGVDPLQSSGFQKELPLWGSWQQTTNIGR